jgi:hypothetical protein
MSGWILTAANWTGIGTASSDNCIDILDACKNALIANTGAKWALDTATGFTGRKTFGSGDTISYGYYFISGDTGAKLCMICTYRTNPFSRANWIGTAVTTDSAPYGLCFAMIPPNDSDVTWNTDDWTSSTWLPDIGLRLTSCCCKGSTGSMSPLAYSNTSSVVYTYWFLCKQDTIFVMFRGDNWTKPWATGSGTGGAEHTRGMVIGNIYKGTSNSNNIKYINYGSINFSGNCSSNLNAGQESSYMVQSSVPKLFSVGGNSLMTSDTSSNISLYWQCFNENGVLCLSRGAGATSSTNQDGRNPEIKTYYGGSIIPLLGTIANQGHITTAMYNETGYGIGIPYTVSLHRAYPYSLTDDFPGISQGNGFKGYIREDLLLCIDTSDTTFTVGCTINNGSYIFPNNGVLLGWDSSNTNIFANPNP